MKWLSNIATIPFSRTIPLYKTSTISVCTSDTQSSPHTDVGPQIDTGLQ